MEAKQFSDGLLWYDFRYLPPPKNVPLVLCVADDGHGVTNEVYAAVYEGIRNGNTKWLFLCRFGGVEELNVNVDSPDSQLWWAPLPVGPHREECYRNPGR